MANWESFSRMLVALKCPFYKEFDFTNRQHLVVLISWLEDRKIRECHITARNSLRTDSNLWDSAFNAYLKKLDCPFSWPDSQQNCLYWVLSFAVSCDYEDELDNSMPITELNLSSITEKINSIGKMISLVRRDTESDICYLQRIYQKLKLLASPAAISAFNEHFTSHPSTTASASVSSLPDFPLGFDSNDSVVNQVSLVLKMLYLSDFRDLQNEINSLIILVQDYTANPRLNTSLGKVGR